MQHKKCPFCGAEPEIVKQIDYEYAFGNEAEIAFIRCTNYLCWARTKECVVQVYDIYNNPTEPPIPDEEVWDLWDRRV